MSKEFLKSVFQSLTENEAWSLQIVQVKNSNKNGTSYLCREVILDPEEKLIDFVQDIQKNYCSENGIEAVSSVDDYTGDVIGHVIYKIDRRNQLISHEFDLLVQSIGNPDREMKISDIKPNAAILKGSVTIDQEDVPVLLVSMQKPISALSNKFMWCETKKFKEIKAPVLSLRKTIDVAIIGDVAYLFTLSGENLFNMERAYKTVCKECVDNIIKCNFITDGAMFSSVANSGRNPSRFVAYNKNHLDWLKNKNNRKKAAEKFGLVVDGDDIKTGDVESVEKLVKFLCNKAMVDPCDESPVEVASTKPWR